MVIAGFLPSTVRPGIVVSQDDMVEALLDNAHEAAIALRTLAGPESNTEGVKFRFWSSCDLFEFDRKEVQIHELHIRTYTVTLSLSIIYV